MLQKQSLFGICLFGTHWYKIAIAEIFEIFRLRSGQQKRKQRHKNTFAYLGHFITNEIL